MKVLSDDRGYLSELLRMDWKDIVKDEIQQILLSVSEPEVIRGWHRHIKGQIDYFSVVKGEVEVWVQPNESEKITVIHLSGDEPKLVRIPGRYWHATKNVGDEPSMTLYFLSELYDYKNPDNEWREVKE